MESGSKPGLQQAADRGEGGGWVLVEARLQGGAPWGFTLQGGLEHGVPVIISKVEEGGKAESLEEPLMVGDEIIIINDVELTGFRQEAIALIKGSYKSLQLTVRRELDPRCNEEFDTSPFSLPIPSKQSTQSPNDTTPCSTVQLRNKNRRGDPASRPHSWHSTKLEEGQHELDLGGTNISGNWHHPHLTSGSTIDLCGGFDSGGSYLRKSPDQYSSRGSMESLDPPLTSQHQHGALQHHALGHHGHGGSHVTYSSCHQLSSARSSNSIDHLHSKRDSAYSSFSTSSSIPEYLAALSSERSYSMETVHPRGGGSGDTHPLDVHCVQAVFDNQRRLSHEHELSSPLPQHVRDSRDGGRPMQSQDLQASGGCFYASSSNNGGSSGGIAAFNAHSMGSLSGPPSSRSSYEDLKGAPAPPRRCDSYGVIRNHDRPNSWSSAEHARSLRSLQRGPWHHSSGSVSSGTAKGGYAAEGQLHTVIEKSPESSPTTKPRQGGGFPQPFPPTDPPSGAAGSTHGINRCAFPATQSAEPEHAEAPGPHLQSDHHGVYPSTAREAKQQQEQRMPAAQGRNEGPTDGGWDKKVSPENGYLYCLYPGFASSQPRAQPQEAQRPHKGSNILPNKTQVKNCVGSSESQKGQRTPNNQQTNSHSLQGPRCKPQCHHHHQVYQEENDTHPIYHAPSAPDLRAPPPKEKNDGFTPVQPWEDRGRRSLDQGSTHSEPAAYPMTPQGQMLPRHVPAPLHSQPLNFSTSQPTSHHPSASGAAQIDHRVQESKDKDDLLTRLENSLTDVQRIPSPDGGDFGSSHDRSGFVDSPRGPVRSLSVLEKVSRFERREHAGKQRTLSTSASHTRGKDLRMNEKGRSSLCGAEDLRHMLERSTKGSKAHRTLSYRGSGSEHTNYRTPADPSSALQRSRSSLQVDAFPHVDSKEQHWRDMLAPPQDVLSNRPYRDSLKNIQSKVSRSMSFRQREISSSVSSAPASGSSKITPSSNQPHPVFTKSNSMEKRGPKTMPKPQGVVFTPLAAPPITSPHTPKERHVVSPDVRGPSPPALPSLPPVGLSTKFRKFGRKRLTADQKKRSFSEPDKMHEVGVSDAETDALFRRGGETSVADRRKMFEHTSVHVGSGALQTPAVRSDLRQVQQEALAEYVERKKSVKRDKWGQKGASRPHSAYLQPDSINYTDTLSLSSTSSLLSLQEIGRDQSSSSGERPLSSALPSGPELQMVQSDQFYPARGTTPRTETQPTSSFPAKSTSELQSQTHSEMPQEAGRTRKTPSCDRDLNVGIEQKVAEPQVSKGVSKPFDRALHTIRSAHSAGMSASADNLLESLEYGQTSHQHHRSRSSPTTESLEQDFFPGDVKMFEVLISESGRCALAANRPADLHVFEGPDGTKMPATSVNTSHAAGPVQDVASSSTPTSRRERQRNSDRQRVQSGSSLAASVGLPCPFSPPGTQDGNITDWQVNERLSQANLDAISFPRTGRADGEDDKDAAGNGDSKTGRHSLSDALLLEDSLMDSNRERTFNLGTREAKSVRQTKPQSREPVELLAHGAPLVQQDTTITAPSPPPVCQPSVNRHFSSLRISESSLFNSLEHQSRDPCTDTPQEDLDDVFLQNLPTPAPSSRIRETIIMEDFPPPPPPVQLEEADDKQTTERFSITSEPLNNFIIPTRKESLQFFPATPSNPGLNPSVPSPAPTPDTPTAASVTVSDDVGMEYKIVPQRARTSEELRVEALTGQLVLQDPTLAPLLNTWGGQSIVERMEEIFTSSKKPNSHWPRKDSLRMEERSREEVCNPSEMTVTDGDVENGSMDGEKDLITRKVELCEALKSSLGALQEEKKALSEEQLHHQDFGVQIETLVQEQLKPNEKEKYNMFIGDLDRIVNLLLSLCSRLYRIDRSLLTLREEALTAEEAAEETESLHHKRALLLRQTEDARELKENLDRRERVVHSILSRYASEPQLRDYHHFVSNKPYFLIYQRYLDDLIRQGEDQLTWLAESLPKEQAEAYGCFSMHSFLGPVTFAQPLTHAILPGPPYAPKSTTVTSL